jgi:hypothetical protein
MARTNAERVSEALDYLKTISPKLEADVRTAVGNRTEQFGAKMSLEGQGLRLIGTGDQHTAVRSLVLCQLAFFTPPYQPGQDAQGMQRAPISDGQILETKKNFLPKLKSSVDAEIKEYVLGDHPSLDGVVEAAKRLNSTSQYSPFVWNVKRSDSVLPGGGAVVCYDGVKAWLFAAGFVSRKWLIKKGILLDANTTHEIFGDGQIVRPENWNMIPRGYFWSIEQKRLNGSINSTVCHWGVSLGMGIAAATNNTTASPGNNQGDIVTLQCITKHGNGQPYATYVFRNMCDVANRNDKYSQQMGAHTPPAVDTYIQVRQYNPLDALQSGTLF